MSEKDQVAAVDTELQVTPDAESSETTGAESPTASDTEQSKKKEKWTKKLLGIIGRCFKRKTTEEKKQLEEKKEQEKKKKQEEKKRQKGKKKLGENKEEGKEEKKEEEKIYNFQKLTPVQDASIDTYAAALDYVFKNDDIRNIAITGTYGSGKSSVIETYEKQHSERTFIHLSLAHFDNEDLQNNGNETEEKKIRTIEGQLLNQLINQIPKRNIPETQFNIKRDIDKRKYIYIAISVCFCLSLAIYNFNYSEFLNFVAKIDDGWTKSFFQAFFQPGFRFIALLAFLALVGYGVYKTIYLLTVKKIIRKVNVKGNEIELFGNSEDSYFDKYSNDIIYLLEHSEADGIIFEDIDRYNNTLVFERLREINVLLHNRQELKNKENEEDAEEQTKIIRFFYLIRDDLFDNNVNKDRTKFFDFIIPIVPVVDGSNSYDKLLDLFSGSTEKVWDELDKRFLRRICIYIDDYRILKNIYNEFLIYREKLNKNLPNCSKLFAMIVYKNIFPRDFAELQFQKGFVHTLFAGKANIIKAYNACLDEEINTIEMDINRRDAEADKEIKGIDRLIEDALDKGNNQEKEKKYSEYLRMQSDIRKRVENLNKPLNDRIQDKRDKKLPDQYYCMRDLIAIDGIDDYIQEGQETFQHIKNNPYYRMLTYLLRSGYIDETYLDYMGIFYPDSSLTTNDKQFIRRVTERIDSSDTNILYYEQHLDSPKSVLDCLEEYDFTHSAVLNYDLFDYMLPQRTRPEVKKLFQNLIQVIINTKDYKYIERYMSLKRNDDKMIDIVTRKGVDMYWLYKSNMQPEILRRFMYEALKADSFEKNGSEDYNGLKNYVSHQLEHIDKEVFQPLLKVSEESASDETTEQSASVFTMDEMGKIRKGICDLKVRFVDIKSETISKVCLDYIYTQNLYDINSQNIKTMVEMYCGKKYDNDFLKTFVSFILNQNELLCINMKKELNHAMTVYLHMYDGKISDPSDTIVEIMNNEKIDQSKKEEYVKRLVYKVGKLKQVESMNCKKLLIQNNAVTYTGDNMLCYYLELGYMDEILTAFVKTEIRDIPFSKEIEKLVATQFISELKTHYIYRKPVYEGETD